MIDIGRDYLSYITGSVVVAISGVVIIRRKWFSFFAWRTGVGMTARRPDLTTWDKNNRVIYLFEIAVSHDFQVKERTPENLTQYQPLKAELARQNRGWKVQVVPVVVGNLGACASLEKELPKNDLGGKISPKGKIPWMTYNYVDMADTQFCIEYLNDILDKDLNKHLTPDKQAVARAFQRLTEENIFWMVPLWNLGFDWTLLNQYFQNVRMGFLFLHYMSRLVRRYAWGHGIGKHSIEEILLIARTDSMALSTYLGDKEFFMGSTPSEIDATVSQFK